MRLIYLDHHTATYVDPQVIEVMKPYMENYWGNYLQPHIKGQELTHPIKEMYQTLYKLIGADPNEDTILFTSSREEAITQAFQIGYQNGMQESGKNHFLTLQVEDASILMNAQRLKDRGCMTEYIPLKSSGVIDVDKIIESISPRTAMISLSLAHGLTGIIQPIEKLKEICHLRGILLHLDVSYAIGKVELDVTELGADLITAAGSAMHGPKSSGFLYVRSGLKASPLIVGGLEQKGWRGGELDVASLSGLTKAVTMAQEQMSEMCLEIASFRDVFEQNITQALDASEVLFVQTMRLPNVSVIAFKNVVSDALLYVLNQKKVVASLGGVQFQRLNHILECLGYSWQVAQGALAFSFAKTTTLEDVNAASQIIIQTVHEMNVLSKHILEGDVFKTNN